MVYKVCKGGVRSGNTLRGLHSLATKRYGRHACLIGRSSLGIKDANRLISAADDSLVSNTLAATNVILSLNKKQRWRVPATVGHMIKTGEFSKEAMISMTERHKLKRRANCVRFLSNKGRLQSVTPTQKRYFSLCLDNLDQDESNRQMRRAKAKALRMQKVPKEKPTRSNTKTIVTYTSTGAPKIPNSVKLESNKAEYRLEVFYPCPQSCSLTFNPKYTDVHLEENEEGKFEVKSNVKPPRYGQQKHRKRLTSRDVYSLASDMVNDDVDEMWREVEEDYSNADEDIDVHDTSDTISTLNDISENDKVFEYGPRNILLSSLIAQAETARTLCSVGKRQRKRGKSLSKNTSSDVSKDEMAQQVFINRGISPSQQLKSNDGGTVAANKDVGKGHEMKFARIIMNKEETTPKALKERFGNLYAEAESVPRRFIINITDDVSNVLSTGRTMNEDNRFISYLVFIHDGVYDTGLDAFKLGFNSYTCTNTDRFEKSVPFERYSIDEIMNCLFGVLLDMKENKELEMMAKYTSSLHSASADFVNNSLKVHVEFFHPNDAVQQMKDGAKMQERSEHEELASQLESIAEDGDGLFCEICYANVNSTHLDSIPGTKLTKCGHLFCDECWKMHLHTKTNDRATSLLCPGYNCDVSVGPVTLLSLFHVTELGRFLQRKAEDELELNVNVKWCQNKNCGRLIQLHPRKSTLDICYDVSCVCGTQMCFACSAPPHWPAKCEQVEEYIEKEPSISLPRETTEDLDHTAKYIPPPPPKSKKIKAFEVEGRLCPSCRRFIEKNGGCPYMMCKCGLRFCWSCMKPWSDHICTPNREYLEKLTRRVIVRHIIPQPTAPLDIRPTREPPKPVKSRKKVSLYQRAKQQRVEADRMKIDCRLTTKISNSAQKDTIFKRELLAICGLDTSTDVPENLALIDVKPHVIHYLKSCQEVKRSLHRVAEFTFVLLEGTPNSVDKQRALRLANDISGFCSFLQSIFSGGSGQSAQTIVKRLVDIRIWASRALDALLRTTEALDVERSYVFCRRSQDVEEDEVAVHDAADRFEN